MILGLDRKKKGKDTATGEGLMHLHQQTHVAPAFGAAYGTIHI